MRLFHSVHILHRPLALILIPLVALGCSNWKVAAVTPQVLIETEHPKAVRVTTAETTDTLFAGTDSTKLFVRGSMIHEVQAPHIAADTLRGLRGKDSVAVALRDIARVEVPYTDWKGAAFMVALIGVLVGLVWYTESCKDNPYC